MSTSNAETLSKSSPSKRPDLDVLIWKSDKGSSYWNKPIDITEEKQKKNVKAPSGPSKQVSLPDQREAKKRKKVAKRKEKRKAKADLSKSIKILEQIEAPANPEEGVVSSQPKVEPEKEVPKVTASEAVTKPLSKNAKKKAKKRAAVQQGNQPTPGEVAPAQPPPNVPAPAIAVPPPAMQPDSFAKLEARLKNLLYVVVLPGPFDHNNVQVKGKMPKIEDTVREMMTRPEMTAQKRTYWWFRMVLHSCREKPLSIISDKLGELAEKYAMNYRLTQKIPANTHGKAKLCRDIVDRLLLDEALQKCEDLGIANIVDYYGSLRGWALWETVTAKATELLQVQPVEWMWYRPIITTKDQLDYASHLAQYPSVLDAPGRAVYVIQDLYMPVHTLLQELNRTNMVCGVVATQLFFSHVKGGIKFGTMPFVQEAGVVRQAAALSDHIWPSTATNDEWITDRSYVIGDRTFMWDTYRRVEDYAILRLAAAEGSFATLQGEQPIDDHSLLEERIIRSRRWKQTLRNWWLRISGQQPVYDRKLYVFMPAIRKYEGSMVLKTRQNYQVSNLQKEVLELMNRPEYDCFWELSHKNKSEVVLDTVTWLTWSGFDNDFLNWEAVSRLLGPDIAQFKLMKTSMTANWAPQWPMAAAAALVLAVGLYFGNKTALKTVFTLPHLVIRDTAEKVLRKVGKRFILPWIPSRETIVKGLTKFARPVNSVLAFPFKVLVTAPAELFSTLVPHEWRPTTILFFLGALGPIVEEKFKAFFGNPGVLWIALAEACELFALSDLTAIQDPIAYFVTLIVMKFGIHYCFAKTPTPIFCHGLWNLSVSYRAQNMPMMLGSLAALLSGLCVTSSTGGGPVNVGGQVLEPTVVAFKDDFERQVSHEEKYLPITEKIPEERTFLPATRLAKPYDDCPVSDAAVLESEHTAGMYILLNTTASFYRPHGPLQFWHAYKQRNCDEVPITYICEEAADPPMPHQTPPWDGCKFEPYEGTDCPVGRAWRYATKLTIAILSQAMVEEGAPLKAADWIAKFNGAAKKARAREAIARRNEGDLFVRSGIFLKADEVLFGRDGFLKGRTVKSLDETVQALAYQSVDSITRMVKEIFDGKTPFRIHQWELTFAVGSGKTGNDLDVWHRQALDWISLGQNRAACIFAGDDFMALVKHQGRVMAYESDFSKMDRTQGVHALGAEFRVLVFMGMPRRVAYFLFQAIMATPRYQNQRFGIKMRLPMAPQRATGGPDTTLGNTLVNMMSVIYAVTKYQGWTKLSEAQLELGLMAKLQIHEDITSATFLKGWWVPIAEGYQWLSLPSQVVKLGKILTNPTHIFPHLSRTQAWRAAAASMACSYGEVPFDYPLFGALLERYRSLSNAQTDLREIMPTLAYRIRRESSEMVDRLACLDMFHKRYGLEDWEISDMEEEIRSTPFPGILVHSGWSVLARRDYG